MIDGAFPKTVQDRLLRRIGDEMRKLDLSGIDPPRLRPGTIGPIARALGGASLPLFDRSRRRQPAAASTAISSTSMPSPAPASAARPKPTAGASKA